MRSDNYIVALEGVDGAGKTSLLDALVSFSVCNSSTWIVHKEFSSPLGPCLQRTLRQLSPLSKLYAFAAERQWRLDQDVSSENIMIFDRFRDSALACRGAEVALSFAEDMTSGNHILEAVDEVRARLPAPDLICYLDVEIAICMERLGVRDNLTDTEMQERTKYVTAQHKIYQRLYRGRPDVLHLGGRTTTEMVDTVTRELRLRGQLCDI